jgi:hypothetical protein
MAAQAKSFVQSSAVQSPVSADQGVVSVNPDDRHDARPQRNSNHLPSRWLTLLDQRLTELHALRGDDELSFTQIAWRLNDEFNMHMSRNAVIGRTHRLNLPQRPSYLRRGRPVKVPTPKSKPTFKMKKAPLPYQPRNLPLIKLRDHDCRFATTGEDPPYLFCAQPVVHGSSWCAVHFKAVHNDVRVL